MFSKKESYCLKRVFNLYLSKFHFSFWWTLDHCWQSYNLSLACKLFYQINRLTNPCASKSKCPSLVPHSSPFISCMRLVSSIHLYVYICIYICMYIPSTLGHTKSSNFPSIKTFFSIWKCFKILMLLFIMGFRLPAILNAKINLFRPLLTPNHAASKAMDVPKGYFAVYVGLTEKKRFVIPLSFLKEPSFQDPLCQAEQEYGYVHSMGGITITCDKAIFFELISH